MGRIRHFTGVESSKQLAFIDDLHSLGLNNTVELPELVVVGDQNTGKSSVLQAITEISFPVEESMCTRFPIKISFRQTSSKPIVKATIIPGPISQLDNGLIDRVKDFCIEKTELTPEAMEEIIKEATQRIFDERALSKSQRNEHEAVKQPTLSDAALRIERSGPDEMHWTIVDLPGLVQSGERVGAPTTSIKSQAVVNGGSHQFSNAAIAEGLVNSYLTNERTIVLVVVDSVDVQRHRSLKLIQGITGLESRSIGVLTKCDLKQETSDQWMTKLLRNDLTTDFRLDHGWFGLRNRKPREMDITDIERDDNERKEFDREEWEGIPSGRTGIKSLMTYIDKERRSQLQHSIPDIIEEIREKLQRCEGDLEKLGEVRDNPQTQRYYVLHFCHLMQKMADGALSGQYQDIPSDDPKQKLRYHVELRKEKFFHDMMNAQPSIPFTNYSRDLQTLSNENPERWEQIVRESSGIYSEIYKEMKIYQGISLPGLIHPAVEEIIFRKQSVHWERIARAYVEGVKNLVNECNDILLKIAVPDSKTRLEIRGITTRKLEEWNKEANSALRELVDDNQKRRMIASNPSLITESKHADQERSDILLGTDAKGDVASEGSTAEVYTTSNVNSGSPEPAIVTTQLSQILFVRARLESYYRIALHRFLDNVVMQVVERHVLGPKCPIRIVSTNTFARLSDDTLNVIAGESEADSVTRDRLKRERSQYIKALAKWDQIRVL